MMHFKLLQCVIITSHFDSKQTLHHYSYCLEPALYSPMLYYMAFYFLQFVFFRSALHIHNSPGLHFSRYMLRLNRPWKWISEKYLKCSSIKYNGYLFLHVYKIANIDNIL